MVGQLTPARCVAAAALRARGSDAPPGVCRRVPSAALEGLGACTGRVPVLDDARRPRSKWAPFGCVHSCLTAASRRSFRQRHPPSLLRNTANVAFVARPRRPPRPAAAPSRSVPGRVCFGSTRCATPSPRPHRARPSFPPPCPSPRPRARNLAPGNDLHE